MNLKTEILKILLKHGCLNTMEICRALNGKPIYDPSYCGIPIYMKPFSNKGKILPQYKEQTGNGICLHFSSCKPNWKQVYNTLHKMHIGMVKIQFYDKGARIKKSKFKLDTFKFWFIDYQAFCKRILFQTLDAYL